MARIPDDEIERPSIRVQVDSLIASRQVEAGRAQVASYISGALPEAATPRRSPSSLAAASGNAVLCNRLRPAAGIVF